MKTAFASATSVAFALALGLTACSENKETKEKSDSSGGSLVSAPTDYLKSAAKAKQSAVKTIDITAVNAALEQFNVGEGRYPTDLNELVSKKYLTAIPTTPFGTKLEYDAKAGTVKIVQQ